MIGCDKLKKARKKTITSHSHTECDNGVSSELCMRQKKNIGHACCVFVNPVNVTLTLLCIKPHLGAINILGLFIASYGTRGWQCIIHLRSFLMNARWKTLKQAISLHLAYKETLSWLYFSVFTSVPVELVSSAVPLCQPLIFHPWQKLHDSMVLWRNWWTASSKMLINTLFYIAAFHFSPTNTALTLSVPPPFCCRGYGYTDLCNSVSTPTPPCTKWAHQKNK